MDEKSYPPPFQSGDNRPDDPLRPDDSGLPETPPVDPTQARAEDTARDAELLREPPMPGQFASEPAPVPPQAIEPGEPAPPPPSPPTPPLRPEREPAPGPTFGAPGAGPTFGGPAGTGGPGVPSGYPPGPPVPPGPLPPPGASASRYPYGVAPPPPPPPRSGFQWAAFLGGTLFGCGCLPFVVMVLFFTAIGSMLSRSTPSGGGGPAKPSVGVINVSGVITSGEPNGGLFGDTGAKAQRIIEQLETARKNPNIKAVVLYIDSPGGSAAGSDAVYNEVLKVKASGKPVIAAMGDVAASGGYYIASAADRIYANGATLTGSIGVISQIPNYSDPNGWISKSGFDVVTVKSGKYKDMGNPFRPVRPEERALFQQMVDDIYSQFLSAVSKGRNMPVNRVRPLADGRVFTGRQAAKNGLIDQVGTLQDAIAHAGKKGGVKEEKGVPATYEFKDNPFDRLFSGPGTLMQGLGGRNPLGLMMLDPRAHALSRGLAAQ